MGSVVGNEVQDSAEDRRHGVTVRQAFVRARVDILDQDSPRRRAVALPQFLAGFAIVCPEVERAVDVDETSRPGAARAWPDVLHQGRAWRGSIALPQLRSVRAVSGWKKGDPIRN